MAGRLFRTFPLLREQSAPSTPASGTMAIYATSEGYFYYKNDAGTANAINPAPVYDSQASTITSLSTSYATYTGAPTVTVTVPSSGNMMVTCGLVGSHSTAGSSVRVDSVFSGANTKAAADTGGVVMMGGGNTGVISVERTTLFTGLTSGSTTVALEARTSNSTGETLYESWLLVQILP